MIDIHSEWVLLMSLLIQNFSQMSGATMTQYHGYYFALIINSLNGRKFLAATKLTAEQLPKNNPIS